MKSVLFLLPILFLPIVQVVHAQSISDLISKNVNNKIENTFNSINDSLNKNNNALMGNGSGSSTTTTTTFSSGPGNSNSATTTMTNNK